LLAVPGGGEVGYCLVDDSDRVCGFGQHWVLTPGSVHLGRIIVSPEVRGRGAGRLLCELLIRAAIESTGVSAVTLRVFRDNAVAAALYSSLGFTEVESESTGDVSFMRMTVNRPLEGTPPCGPRSASRPGP
jgi:ribosomal protein S18 acetylase RimI-like enzyme